MRIFDFHTHIYPDQIAGKATQSICDFYDLHTDFTGTADTLLSRGRLAGITNYLLLPVAVKPEHVHHINQFIVREVAEHPEFYGFGSLHAGLEDMTAELQYIQDAGLRGIKFHPDTQQFAIDDPRLLPVFEAVQDRLPILFHCGDQRYDYSHPRRLRHVLELFPRLRVIAAHLGGWSVFDEAYSLLKDKDCLVDMSSSRQFLPAGQLLQYINAYGEDRVLFGSDFPLWDPAEEARAFLQLDLTQTAREKIAYKNALAVLES